MKKHKKILVVLLLTVLLADLVAKTFDQFIPSELSSVLSVIIMSVCTLVTVFCLILMWKISDEKILLKVAVTAYVAVNISEMAIDRYLLPEMSELIGLSVVLNVIRIILILLILMLTFDPNKEKDGQEQK